MGNTPSSPKRQRFRIRYLLFAAIVIVILVLYFGYLAIPPNNSQSSQSVGLLLVIVVVTAIVLGILGAAADVLTVSPKLRTALLHLLENSNVNGDANQEGTRTITSQALHRLPPPPPDFTVRAADLEAILNDIEHGAVRYGVCGMSGIGKTALALVIANQLKEKQYPDAQFYIKLRGASDRPLKPIDAMRSVIRAYHPTAQLPNDETGIADLYCSMLEGQRAIVLLDDAKDAAQITPLLPPDSCLLLVTTRQHFHVPGLRVHNLETLSPADARKLLIKFAPRLEGIILSRAEENDLLANQPEILSRLRMVHALSGAERRGRAERNDTVAVADVIAHFCGYLPLALCAAASLIAATPNLTPFTYAVQLCKVRTRLARIGKEGVEIDVEASLNLSYKQLPPDARRVFRQLSVFPASFDAAAEEAVCEDINHAHLTQLMRLSLVEYIAPAPPPPRDNAKRPTGASRQTWAKPVAREGIDAPAPVPHAIRGLARQRGWGGDRYRFHGLTRLFAAARLAKCNKDCTVAARLAKCNEDCAAAQLRHAAHYKDVLAKCNDFYLQGNDSLSQGLALFDREWPNIRAGQAWAATHAKNDGKAAALCSDYPHSGADILALRQHPRERIKWLGPALAAARRLKKPADEAAHLGSLGLAYADLGKTRTAIECYEQALLITRAIGDRRSEGHWLGHLGVARADLGETDKAIESYKQALDIARDAKYSDKRREGNWLGHLGLAYKDLGEVRQVIEELYEQALSIARASGDRRGEGNWLGHCGNAYFARDETHKAIEFHEKALGIARDIGNRCGESIALGNLGFTYAKLGETRKAIEEFYEQALDIARDIGDRRGEGTTLFNMALALDELGEYAQAIAHAKAALKIYAAVENPNIDRVRQAVGSMEKT